MSAQWEGQALLEPISPEQPCGENLEDTAAVVPRRPPAVRPGRRRKRRPTSKATRKSSQGETPDRMGQIRGDALDGLSKSKDLRLLAYLGTALLRTDGLPAFTQDSRWRRTGSRPTGCRCIPWSTRTRSPGGTR